MEENDTPPGSNSENTRPFNGLTLDEFLAKTLDNPGEAVLRALNMTPEQYRAAREKGPVPDTQEETTSYLKYNSLMTPAQVSRELGLDIE